MRDDEWGFFIDLEIDCENITKKIIQPIKTTHSNSRKTVNYMSTIYEDDYWYEREDFHHEYEGEYEIKSHKQDADENEKENEKKYKQIQSTTTVIIYCIFCASVISWTLTMV